MLSNTLSAIGASVLQSREGLRLVGYLDSVNVPTVGWGHTGPEVRVGMRITKAQAIKYFNDDVGSHAAPINRLVKVPLSENQYDALVSFLYNVGETNFRKSGLLRALNRGDFNQAVREFDKWHKPDEITSRRNAERDQFKTPYSVAMPKARSNDARPVKRPIGAPLTLVSPSVEESIAKPNRPSVGGALASLWAKIHPLAAVVPASDVKGDPVVFSVQKQLKDKGYYLNGFLDGIDGPKYRDAVAAARKDNGLGDGPADAAFITALPTFGMRPVAGERAKADFAVVKAHAPDLALPVGTMWKAGLGILGLGGADAANQGGLLDTLKSAGDNANDVLGTVQGAFGTIAGIVQFLVEHRTWIFIAIGLYLLFRAASFALNLIIRIRQAFF